MACEMCGKNGELVKAIVEGSVLNVCRDCGRHGSIIEEKKVEIKEKRGIESKDEVVEFVINGYGERIKKAREERGLTQEKLAIALAEKESVIHKLESGQLKPSDSLARKLEQFLRIRILDEYKEEYKVRDINFNDGDLTIGDLLKLKNEQKKA